MKTYLVLVGLLTASMAYGKPQFQDCNEASSKGKYFVIKDMMLRRQILGAAIKAGRSANVENSPAFRYAQKQWTAAVLFMVQNQCTGDDLLALRSQLGSALEIDLRAAIAAYYPNYLRWDPYLGI